MKVLFIYPNAQGYGRIPLGVSVIISVLLNRGHEVELFDTTFLLANKNIDNMIREKAQLVLPTATPYTYDNHPAETVDKMLRDGIKKVSPQLIAISIVEDNYQYADRLLGVIKDSGNKIPVIAGGSTPTIAPEVIIENEHIDYLVQGEGEETMEEFCDSLEKGRPVDRIRNLWYKKDGVVKSNPVRPFINMDTLPAQNLDVWDNRHFFKPYAGKVVRAGYFEMSRGCLNKCSYCINYACRKMLRKAGNYHRKKSVQKSIHEIKILKKKHGLEMIFFCDDNFLLMSGERMEEFAEMWKSEIGIPYWINTTVECISAEKLAKLKETGCCGIGLGIESGSEWLRKNILKRAASNERIEKAFALIHDVDIRTTANTMVGFPGEYEEDIFETIKLVKSIRPRSADMTFVAPYIGTAIHGIAKKLGYIDTWDKPGFRGMARNVSMRSGPVIKTPQIAHQRLLDIFYKFADYIEGRLPIPDEYLKPAPGGAKGAPARGNMSKDVLAAFDAIGCYS